MANRYTNKTKAVEPTAEPQAPTLDEQKSAPLCKYCTENYLLARGRGIRQQLIPIEPNYCPMCGRKLLPTDRDY